MNYQGLAKGNTIELTERLPFRDGEPLLVSVESAPLTAGASAAALRRAMRAAPHLGAADVEEMEFAIRQGKLPASAPWAFNEGK